MKNAKNTVVPAGRTAPHRNGFVCLALNIAALAVSVLLVVVGIAALVEYMFVLGGLLLKGYAFNIFSLKENIPYKKYPHLRNSLSIINLLVTSAFKTSNRIYASSNENLVKLKTHCLP